MTTCPQSDFADLLFDAPPDPQVAAERKSRKIAARAKRTRSRIEARRASSEDELSAILPARIEEGDSWHVISGGNIDAISYPAHILAREPFESLTLSTWCIALDDVLRLKTWLESATLRRLDAYVGEIFPGQYPEAYTTLCDVVRRLGGGGRVATFRNHSKVILLANDTTRRYLVMEGSANVNTNPRTEQTIITADAGLYRFYADFFAGIKSYNRNFDDWTPHHGQAA